MKITIEANTGGISLAAFLTSVLAVCGAFTSTSLRADDTFTLGGTVIALRGSGLTLSSNGQTVAVDANGDFTFPAAFASGTAYNVIVARRPSSPTQGCLIANGRGTLTANVANVQVACLTSRFTVGGTVRGYRGQALTLKFNDQPIHIAADGPFAYPTTLASGTTYNVAVAGQPGLPSQRCVVTNGNGTVTDRNINDIIVDCVDVLRLNGSTPSDGAYNVSRVHQPWLYFTFALNAATVTSNTVKLTARPGEYIDLDFSVSGSRLIITPRTPMLPGTNYAIEVGRGLQGSGGEELEEPFDVTFTTGQATWQGAQTIATGGYWPHNARITNKRGTFATVWMQANGILGLNRYSPRAGWSGSAYLNTYGGHIYDPQVMLDNENTTHVIWAHGDGTLLSSRHTTTAGWSAIQPVFTDSVGTASSPRAGIDDAGNIIAVWKSVWAPNTHTAWANRYVPGSGWGAPVVLESGGDTSDLSLVVNPAGDAMALWHQYHGESRLWSNRYIPGSGWGAAERIDVGDAGEVGPFSHLAMAAGGTAIAVYTSYSGSTATVRANSYTYSSGWSTSEPISGSLAGSSFWPQVAIDRDGNAFAVWIQRGAGSTDQIWGNTRSADGVWSTPYLISVSTQQFTDLRLAMEGQRDPLIVVRKVNGTSSSILAARLRSTGWVVGPIETHPATTTVVEPGVDADESGSALAVWISSDPSGHRVHASVLE